MKTERLHVIIAVVLIAAGVGLRLLPHPANFAPIAAIAIFGGAVLPRKMAVWVPLGAMMASDLFLGLHDTILATWGCYALIALASSYWLRKPNLLRGVAMTLGSSVLFFVITNFAVWVVSGMYAHTWAGLTQCYYMALPFFRGTVTSDVIYTAVLFGAYALASLGVRHFAGTKRQGLLQG